MARDPGSTWAPLSEAGAPDGMVKDKFIVHSTGDNGTAAATRRYFELASTVTESTFIIGWGPERNDPTLQIMDSTDIADANVGANRSGISVEVVGDGKSGYTPWQRSELVRLARWARTTHPGILPRICPSPTAPGFGWHVMFGAPGPWAAVAKSCPGGPRIVELKSDIFPAIFTGADVQEDDMTPEQDKILRGISDKLGGLQYFIQPSAAGSQGELMERVRSVDANLAAVKQLLANNGDVDINDVQRIVNEALAASQQSTQQLIVQAVQAGMEASKDATAEDIAARLVVTVK
jgi:hypothetical protein